MKVVKYVLFGLIVAGLLIVCTTCYFQNCRKADAPTPPDATKAQYEIIVKSTNGHYFSDNVTVTGGAYRISIR